MNQLERRDAYETAMRRMSEHIVQAPNGLFVLKLTDPSEIDIDPIVFADLKRSLEETNKKIASGEIKESEVR